MIFSSWREREEDVWFYVRARGSFITSGIFAGERRRNTWAIARSEFELVHVPQTVPTHYFIIFHQFRGFASHSSWKLSVNWVLEPDYASLEAVIVKGVPTAFLYRAPKCWHATTMDGPSGTIFIINQRRLFRYLDEMTITATQTTGIRLIIRGKVLGRKRVGKGGPQVLSVAPSSHGNLLSKPLPPRVSERRFHPTNQISFQRNGKHFYLKKKKTNSFPLATIRPYNYVHSWKRKPTRAGAEWELGTTIA